MRAKIIGTGSFLPPATMTNQKLSTLVDTDDAWIKSRTGIQERRLATMETTSSMASAAAKNALENANLKTDDIDLILVATVSGDHLVPSTACIVQKELGAYHAVAFDINAACSGFLFALQMADAFFQSGTYQNALVIGVETLSKLVDWSDRGTCVLFGDGAGAAVVTAASTGMIAGVQGSDGSGGHVLSCPGRSNRNPFFTASPSPDCLFMNGQEVFKFAVKKVPECILDVLHMAKKSPDEIDFYVLHQANMRIIAAIAKKLKLPLEKFPSNVDRYGNTSAASVPILLDEINRKGLLHPGDQILLAGFGAGLTWAAALLTW